MTSQSETAAAGHLLNVLNRMVSHPNVDGMTTHQALASILECEGKNARLYERLGLVVNLFDRVLNDIKSSQQLRESSKKHYLSVLKTMRVLVVPESFSTRWSSLKEQNLQARDLQILMLLDDSLSREFPGPKVEAADIKSAISELENLRKKLESLDIPLELAEVVQLHIDGILFALKNFDLYGLSGIKESIIKSLSKLKETLSLIPNPGAETESWSDSLRDYLSRIWKWTDTVESVDRKFTAIGRLAEKMDGVVEIITSTN